MSNVNKPNTFSANTTISASEVNDNFDVLYNDYNGGISAANLATGSVTTAKIADSNVTTAKIADANVTNDKLAMQAWQSWTPSLTNLSGGTLDYAKYMQIGKTVLFRFKYTMTGANVSGNVLISLPVTPNSELSSGTNSREPIGDVVIRDAGTATWYGKVLLIDTDNEMTVAVSSAAGTYVSPSVLSSTIPITWASGDTLTISGFYEAA